MYFGEEEGEEAEGRGAAHRQHPGQALKRHQIPLSIEGPVCVKESTCLPTRLTSATYLTYLFT